MFEPFEHCYLVDPQGCYCRSPCQTQKYQLYSNQKWSNPTLKETVTILSQLSVQFQNNISQLIHKSFGHISINRLKQMTRKGIMEGLPENIPDLEEP